MHDISARLPRAPVRLALIALVVLSSAPVLTAPAADAQVPALPPLPPQLDPVLEPLRPTCESLIVALFPVLGEPALVLADALGCAAGDPPSPAVPPADDGADPAPATPGTFDPRTTPLPLPPQVGALPVLAPLAPVGDDPLAGDVGPVAQPPAQPVSSGRFHYRVVFLFPLLLVVVGAVLARTLAAPVDVEGLLAQDRRESPLRRA